MSALRWRPCGSNPNPNPNPNPNHVKGGDLVALIFPVGRYEGGPPYSVDPHTVTTLLHARCEGGTNRGMRRGDTRTLVCVCVVLCGAEYVAQVVQC